MNIRNLVTGTAIAVTAAAFVLGRRFPVKPLSQEGGASATAFGEPARSVHRHRGAPPGACRTPYRNACWAGNDGAVGRAEGLSAGQGWKAAGKRK